MIEKFKKFNLRAFLLALSITAMVVVLTFSIGHTIYRINKIQSEQDKITTQIVKSQIEKVYFLGQVDALNGKIKIQKVGSTYQWIDTIHGPYSDLTIVSYKP